MSVSGAFDKSMPDELATTPIVSQESQRESSSALERFINSFLREQNIRWMLVIGAAIVFGSSLMLVSREFSSWPVGVKYLTVLCYTGMIFAAAEIGRARLGLKATSRVLHVLTLFLLPVCFLALNWATSSGLAGSLMNVAEAIAWGIPATAFLLFAATRIFDHQLRGRQTTFVAAYVILSIAGALPKITHPLLSFSVSLVLWFVMSAGMIKVTRHIFWLTEENRWPRIFAFFPSLLLGALFLILMVTRTAVGVSVEWIGFGCVLVSASILMNARTVADVFRQRTGDLVRPLPWSIVLPMLVGLIWMVAGLGLAFAGFPRTFALVPTCALATAMLIVAARETNHRGFVWAALIAGLMTYQFLPTLFRETAMAMSNAAAAGLQTPKLPVAFYGLTYLPLILGVATLYRVLRTRTKSLLVEPLRTFACCLAVILQVAAITNAQALFLVSAVNVVMFYVLGMILRERSIARISLISLVAAVTMLIPFLAADSGSTKMIILLLRSTSSIAMSLGVLGFVLAVTRIGDRLLQLVPDTASVPGENSRLDRLSELAGLLLSGGVALYWTALSFWNALRPESSSVTWIHCLLPLTTFAVHTFRYRNLLSGFVFWALMLTGFVYVAVETNVSWEMFSSGATLGLGIGSVAGNLWSRSNRSQSNTDEQLTIRNAFLVPFNWLSTGVMFAMTVLLSLPMLMYHNLNQSPLPMPLTTTMTVVWLIAATLILNSRVAGLLSAMITPLLASALVMSSGLISHLSWTQIFVIWATTSSACSILFSLMRNPSTELALMISRAWMLSTLAISTTSFNHEYRIVPAVVLPALLLVNRSTLSSLQRTILAILANVHGLLLVGGSMGMQGVATSLFASPESNLLRLYFAALTISVIVFEYLRSRLEEDLVEVWQVILRICGGLAVFTSLLGGSPTPVMSVITIATFSAAAVFEFWNAVRRQEELYIWNALVVIAGCIGWMVVERLIVPGTGMSQILLMVLSAIALTVAEKSRDYQRAHILIRPMRIIGVVLPMVVSLLALLRTTMAGGDARGLQALAVFGCAAVYFHQWLLSRRRLFLLLAGAVVNLAFVLLWRSLHFSDPQFYMVPIGLSVLGLIEILKKELPASSHDPLRYIGALIILVSPVFDILSGSWAHLLSLLVLSTLVVLLSIGLRLRALMYTGTAFILADLAGMIFRATEDRMSLLWIGGLGLGIAVIALAAICENHRDRVLARIRSLSAALATWE
jgi:hypothetical protein